IAAMAKHSYAQALVDALHDSLAADDRVSLIGSYVLGLGPQRHLMDRIRQDFPDRVVDPPTAEAGAGATRGGAAPAGKRPLLGLRPRRLRLFPLAAITPQAPRRLLHARGPLT